MNYQLLPFRFERFNENEYLLTNEVGEYIFLQVQLINATLCEREETT